jgi:histone deacetylase 1/2
MHALAYSYWVVIKRILRSLKGTTSFGLHITCSASFSLYGFTDADWASSVDDRKSSGSFLVFFGHTLISWKSRKQHIVTQSSIETEYKGLADGTSEVIWLQYLFLDLQITPSVPTI